MSSPQIKYPLSTFLEKLDLGSCNKRASMTHTCFYQPFPNEIMNVVLLIHTGAVLGAARMEERQGFRRFSNIHHNI